MGAMYCKSISSNPEFWVAVSKLSAWTPFLNWGVWPPPLTGKPSNVDECVKLFLLQWGNSQHSLTEQTEYKAEGTASYCLLGGGQRCHLTVHWHQRQLVSFGECKRFLFHEHIKECGQGRKQFYSNRSSVTSMSLKLKGLGACPLPNMELAQ